MSESEPQRAATLAARTRNQLAELRGLKDIDQLAAQARREVLLAEKALAAAKAKLRELAGSKPIPTRRDLQPLGVSSKTIREWALANGHQVSAIGQIPKPVLAAYADAHPDGGDAS